MLHEKKVWVALGGIALFLFLTSWWGTSPSQAQEEATSAATFLHPEDGFSLGPPLPAELEVVLSVTSTFSGTIAADETMTVTLKMLAFVAEDGQPLATGTLIPGYPDGGYTQTVPVTTETQFVTFAIPINQNLAWNTYKGQMITVPDGGSPVSQTITMVAGPAQPPVILSPKIVITAIGCPDIVTVFDTTLWRRALRFLCPGHYLAEEDRFQVKIQGDGDRLSMIGFDAHYIGTAAGVAVSEEGAGRIRLLFDREQNLQADARDHRLRISGSANSGKYEGSFYLNTDRPPEETETVGVLVLVRDYWLLPLITLIAGLLVSAGIAQYYDIWLPGEDKRSKERKRQAQIQDAREELAASLDQFVDPEKPYKKDGFYRIDPDIVYETRRLLAPERTVSLEELEAMKRQFQRFQDFFDRLYEAHQWYESVQQKAGGGTPTCREKLEALGKGLAGVKKRLWTADTERMIEYAQDRLIATLLMIDELIEMNCIGAAPAGGRQTTPITLVQPLLLNKSFQLSSIVDTRTIGHGEAPGNLLDRVVRFPQKALSKIKTWLMRSELIWGGLRFLLIVLSGIYVVYLSDATFGTASDYLWAFLWGSTTEAALKAVRAILGSTGDGILSAFSGLAGK